MSEIASVAENSAHVKGCKNNYEEEEEFSFSPTA
jgi:hypothetical protein